MGSGGDAPGMNPAIKRFVEYSLEQGAEPWFVIDGLEGLIDGNIRPASYKDVAGIIHRGGADRELPQRAVSPEALAQTGLRPAAKAGDRGACGAGRGRELSGDGDLYGGV